MFDIIFIVEDTTRFNTPSLLLLSVTCSESTNERIKLINLTLFSANVFVSFIALRNVFSFIRCSGV